MKDNYLKTINTYINVSEYYEKIVVKAKWNFDSLWLFMTNKVILLDKILTNLELELNNTRCIYCGTKTTWNRICEDCFELNYEANEEEK